MGGFVDKEMNKGLPLRDSPSKEATDESGAPEPAITYLRKLLTHPCVWGLLILNERTIPIV
jgi:hypothetical protein